MLLVTREPVERLGDNDIKPAGTGVLQELLVAGTKMRRAAARSEQEPHHGAERGR